MISPATRSGTLNMERMPSFSSTSRCAERGSSLRSSERTGRPDAAARPMMPSPIGMLSTRHSGVRNPWAAAWSMAVRSALKSPMPHPVLPMRPVTARLIASSTERRSSRAVMSWVVRLRAASSSARCTISPCRRVCSMAEASGRATSVSTSMSASVKARGSWWMALRVPITSPCENSGTRITERMPRRDRRSRLTGGTDGSRGRPRVGAPGARPPRRKACRWRGCAGR